MEGKRGVEFLVPAFLIVLVAAPFMIVGVIPSETSEASEAEGSQMVRDSSAVPLGGLGRDDTDSMESKHVPLPIEVRGIYWTASTALSPRADELLAYMLERGLNTVVIDAKMDDGEALEPSMFVPVLDRLADAGIYRIARIAVMRDSAFAQAYPNLALGSGREWGIWHDNTGAAWLDPAASEVADYAIELGRALYAVGFDEIQFDYVRFPSDGETSSIVYPVFDGDPSKIQIMQTFFKNVGSAMREAGIPVSFDVFGMTFWSFEDYDIGQRLMDVFAYADWVSPMVYPSHYPDGFEGFANPAEAPYEIVSRSLQEGLAMLRGVSAMGDAQITSRFRPWLQDFDLGAIYTASMIEAQIAAARKAGASGWLLWNARNVYEPAEYLPVQ